MFMADEEKATEEKNNKNVIFRAVLVRRKFVGIWFAPVALLEVIQTKQWTAGKHQRQSWRYALTHSKRKCY